MSDTENGNRSLQDALASTAAWGTDFVATAVVDETGARAYNGDAQRRVRVASITKPIVAYAVLVAVEEGIIDLDRPIHARDSLDEEPIPLGLTVRHLLAHAGGYGFEERQPVAPPGLRRIYSNTGFELLGQLLEQASEMPAASYVDEAVFRPLGMQNSSLLGSAAKDVWSNVSDLVRFVGELLRPTLLAPATYGEFITVQWPELAGVVPGLGSYRPCPWGLGMELRGHKQPHWTGRANSAKTFGHFGGTGTFFWVDPDAAGGPVGLICLTDREFGPWALAAWPALSDAVLSAWDSAAF